jgi:serpin B
MFTQKLTIIVVLLIILISSCAPAQIIQTNSESSNTPSSNVLSEEKYMVPKVLAANIKRDPIGNLPNPELQSLVKGNNEFAFSLFQILNQDGPQKNLVFSPYSISLALAMTYGGAKGETANEMQQVLRITQSVDGYNESWNNLDQWLSMRAENPGVSEEGYKLKITNAVWAQQDYPFLESYLEQLARYFGAGLQTTDFERFPEESRIAINNWVAEETAEKIKNLIPQGAIHPLTRMALINAIYLNAAWRLPFDKENTSAEEFHLLDGSNVEVAMMSQTQDFNYYVGETLKMVELPYSGGQLSMVLVIPTNDTFLDFSDQFNHEILNDLMAAIEFGKVKINLPRYKFDQDFNLNEMFKKLGMPQAFDPEKADFTGMESSGELYIDEVIHKAFIDVNEAGTEAAASTAVLMAAKGFNPVEPVEITFDHPFIFIIRDRESGSILFIGQVMVPQENL